ncbi:MAG: hypothetical protein RJP95_04905, partial [Pirellulales bacterium]
RSISCSSGGARVGEPSIPEPQVSKLPSSPPAAAEDPADLAKSIALRFIRAEAYATKTNAKGPTQAELQAVPSHTQFSAIKLIFQVRKRLEQPTQFHDLTELENPAQILQILRSPTLTTHERWALVATRKRLSPEDSYRRTKLLRKFFSTPNHGDSQ